MPVTLHWVMQGMPRFEATDEVDIQWPFVMVRDTMGHLCFKQTPPTNAGGWCRTCFDKLRKDGHLCHHGQAGRHRPNWTFIGWVGEPQSAA